MLRVVAVDRGGADKVKFASGGGYRRSQLVLQMFSLHTAGFRRKLHFRLNAIPIVGMLALFLPNALSFEVSLVRSRLTAQTSHSPSSLIVMKTEALPDSPADLDEGSCYLIDTDEGFVPHPLTQPASQRTHSALSWPGRRKYVCTDNPQELARMVC